MNCYVTEASVPFMPVCIHRLVPFLTKEVRPTLVCSVAKGG